MGDEEKIVGEDRKQHNGNGGRKAVCAGKLVYFFGCIKFQSDGVPAVVGRPVTYKRGAPQFR